MEIILIRWIDFYLAKKRASTPWEPVENMMSEKKGREENEKLSSCVEEWQEESGKGEDWLTVATWE